MNTLKNILSPQEQARLHAQDRWYRAFEDEALRNDCPDAYHEELLRQADELDRQRLVTWQEWRDLRIKADRAYLCAVAGREYEE
ncbi:hypothetical protein BS643_22790 [Pseudomonas protegens]|nr:hypothetical protein [Pseudomonas protegens]OBZ20200.1 hypothetical protein BBH58_28510 [Pseudomonas protegens]OBZ21303.1 hypothetical protein BBH57_28545 [Pseudomonas protegens]OKK40573.1 hypothetical protein BS643_22790 [Pseudomonas protegens]OKK52833.1 hypothetical protein BS644_03075 [Pseudomonas protegens]OKK58325.1 hypothetical protein BS646_24690 [Pseudomonas protegens]